MTLNAVTLEAAPNTPGQTQDGHILLLNEAIASDQTAAFNPSAPEDHPLADMLTSGGTHAGFSVVGCGILGDMLVNELPSPPIAETDA